MMNNLLQDLLVTLKIEEGQKALENILLSIYFREGISAKELSREVMLPVPVVVAVKNEFKKKGIIGKDCQITLTPAGIGFVEEVMKFKGLDIEMYKKIISDRWNLDEDFKKEMSLLVKIFDERPSVDVTVDQSQCTVETSIKRAILCLKNRSLIGKKILCVGDDDLVSVSLGFLIRKLFPKEKGDKCSITVLDIDKRFVDYIKKISEKYKLPIEAYNIDLRNPIEEKFINQYDCFFTDPPYTMAGMELFISRGISALKKEVGLNIFFSYAQKTPGFNLNMQQSFVDMGLMISAIIHGFNKYEGAKIIGGTGQMIVLKTTGKTEALIKQSFHEAIYTGEIKRTIRTYQCKNCMKQIQIGFNRQYKTIENLKDKGCPKCKKNFFNLIGKQSV